MKISVDISPEHTEPYAVIYTSQMTDEIQRLIEVFGNSESPITALRNEKDLIILQPKDIFMVRVENGDTSQYHRFKRWFGISPIRADYLDRLKAVLQALHTISA